MGLLGCSGLGGLRGGVGKGLDVRAEVGCDLPLRHWVSWQGGCPILASGPACARCTLLAG
jgi:hypothetical protein